MNWYKSAVEYRSYDPEGIEDYDDEQGFLNEELATQGDKVFNESEIRPDSTKDIRDLALEDGTVIGATASGWSTYDETAIFAFDIAVKPEFRGKGIGTNLIERALEKFESERYMYEEMGQKTAIRLEAINVKLGESIIRNYGFKLEQKLPDRIILYKE
ncbi:MAG: GNAT family N-acetyltransferase [Candidatus Scalindua sp.]|jgi:GNAT superfamily N-acetyltransferase|nr:GNAT family N-acetyltransferase [Candidatus Scalindua sp.]